MQKRTETSPRLASRHPQSFETSHCVCRTHNKCLNRLLLIARGGVKPCRHLCKGQEAIDGTRILRLHLVCRHNYPGSSGESMTGFHQAWRLALRHITH